MNWLKRKALDLFYSPQLGSLVESAGGIRRAVRDLELARKLNDYQQFADNTEKREMQEASTMLSGPMPVALAESSSSGTVPLKERFWELELALEDRGWKRQLAVSELEFSRYGIQQLILMARLYFIKNPLIKRGVKISSFYVFGRGVDISSDDEAANDALQSFLADNKKELGHCGLVEKDQTLRTDGNLYFAFFTSLNKGETKVRTIDAIEIQEIITDPNDSSQPWYYFRYWEEKAFNEAAGRIVTKPAYAWYPAINYDPPAKPKEMRGYPVLWESPVYHVKVGGLPKWLFGCPEVYAEIDWARAAKKNLENWASITESLARFSWNVETQGGSQAIQKFSDLLSTTLGNCGTQIESNPPANVASTFVTGPGNKLTPIRTSGLATSPEEVRRLILMVCAASGLPETFYGDASTGSLATAQSLDRPTELQFLQRQELWREVIQTVCLFALGRSYLAPSGTLKEANRDPSAVTVKVDFPAILEHDINARIGAIVEAMTLNGFEVSGIDEKTAVGMLLAELGYENWPELLDKMYPETGPNKYDPDRAEVLNQKKDSTLNPPVPPQGVEGPQGTAVSDAPPHAPGPRQPRVKRVPPPKEAERAVYMLRKTLQTLRERASGQ